MSRRRAFLAALGLLVACASQAGAAPAADGRITGRVAPPLRPGAGTETAVQAIDASNLLVAASGQATRSGTYRLTVPPGVYLVAAEKLGRAAPPAIGFSRLVRVRSGKTASPPQIVRRPQSAARSLPHNGKPVLAVKEFTTQPAGTRGGDLARMLKTDLWIAGNPCVVVAEWIRRADILAEIRLQQSNLVDPSTRVTPRLLQPDIFVEGSVSTTASTISWSIRMRRARGGRVVASDSGSAPMSRFLDISRDIAKRLLEQLGADCLPQRIEGSFSGEFKQSATTTFTGTIRFDRLETPTSGGVAEYRVSRVGFTTTIDGKPTCAGRFTEGVTLTNVPLTLARLVMETRKSPGKGHRYFVVSMFQSPRQRQITLTCNGVPATIPWVPAAALNTGSNHFSDGLTFKGTNNEIVMDTYRWDLRGQRLGGFGEASLVIGVRALRRHRRRFAKPS